MKKTIFIAASVIAVLCLISGIMTGGIWWALPFILGVIVAALMHQEMIKKFHS